MPAWMSESHYFDSFWGLKTGTDAPLKPIEAPHAATQKNLGNRFKTLQGVK